MNYESFTLWQSIRKWPRATVYILLCGLNVLLRGYDSAILSSVASLSAFQKVFGVPFEDRYIIPSMWLSIWAVSFPIGSMVGATAGGWLQDRTGRKWTLCIGGVLSVGAIGTAYAADLTANPRIAFLFGKFIEGIAIGFIMCSTQTYLSEIVPARLRGPTFALFPILILLGQLAASGISLAQEGVPGKSSYRTAIASEWPFSICPIVLAFMLPESPAWLLRKDRVQDARDAFRNLHGSKRLMEYQDLFEDMHTAVNEEKFNAGERGATYVECFRGPNLRRTLIVLFATVLPELFGLNLLGDASYFLQMAGMDHTMSFVFMILGVVLGLISNVTSFWTLLKFGRRLLTNTTLAIVTVVWLSIGISGCFSGPGVANYTAAGMMIVVVVAGVGVWPASYVITAETSSLRLRSKTQGVSWLIGGVIRCAFDIVFPFLYNKDAADLGSQTGFVYFATATLATALSFLYVPELKGRSTVEIDRMFEQRLPTRQFRGYKKVGGSDDALPLHQTSRQDRERAVSDASSLQDDNTLTTMPSASTGESFEPLRKRPTF